MTIDLRLWFTFYRATIGGILLALCAGPTPCSAQTVGNKELPIVWILSTGGTIAVRGASSTDLSNYKAGSLLGDELVRAIPEIRRFANVKVEQIVNVSSSDITLDNWLTIAHRINQLLKDDPKVAGVVVTHGQHA
jgi:L-asparaginase